jgi:hypothetical protein
MSGSTTPSGATDRAMDQSAVSNPRGNRFASEAEAQSNCRGDTVVWVNTKSHVYHLPGSSAYGNTKHGAFMCRADADRSGVFRAAKAETAMRRGTATQNPGRSSLPQSGSSMNR